MSKCFISYRHVQPDEELANSIKEYLLEHDHQVFIDKQILVGTKWAAEIDRKIRTSDFFVVLLSKESIRSDMVRQEVKLAYELLQSSEKKISILPIRVAFRGELPYDLGSYLDPIQYAVWTSNSPFKQIAEQILASVERSESLPNLGKSDTEVTSETGVKSLFDATEASGAPLPAADPRLIPHVELETGTIKLDSPFYIKRENDDKIFSIIKTQGTSIILKGPRQIGKSSLLVRANAEAQANKQQTCYLDFQFIDSTQFQDLRTLFQHLANKIARGFKTSNKPSEIWDENLGAKDNLTYFIEESLLCKIETPILLLFDEVDRLFDCPFRDDFFATIRGWHNLRAQKNCWNNFNIILAHSTEPYLWIQDINQSPFNVGYRFALEDFNQEQISRLNAIHSNPLKTEDEIIDLMTLIGGQPYLVRQSFYCLTTRELALNDIKNAALDERGPFGDHLRRFIWCLQQSKELKDTLRQILRRNMCDDEVHFQRLSAAGLVKGEDRHNAHMRCLLYENYFKKHL